MTASRKRARSAPREYAPALNDAVLKIASAAFLQENLKAAGHAAVFSAIEQLPVCSHQPHCESARHEPQVRPWQGSTHERTVASQTVQSMPVQPGEQMQLPHGSQVPWTQPPGALQRLGLHTQFGGSHPFLHWQTPHTHVPVEPSVEPQPPSHGAFEHSHPGPE